MDKQRHEPVKIFTDIDHGVKSWHWSPGRSRVWYIYIYICTYIYIYIYVCVYIYIYIYWLFEADWTAPSHYLNQCWNNAKWALRNKLQWHFYRNSNNSIEENSFENVVCEMLSISSWTQYVKCKSSRVNWGNITVTKAMASSMTMIMIIIIITTNNTNN